MVDDKIRRAEQGKGWEEEEELEINKSCKHTHRAKKSIEAPR